MIKFLFFLLFGLTAMAQTNFIDGKYGVNTKLFTNYVKNQSCNKNTANITASGGSLTRNTTAPLEDGGDCAIDASASAQTYTWATFSLDNWLAGQNCEARFVYKGDASLYKAYVNVNSVKVTTDLQLTSQTATPKEVSILFPCGAQPLTTSFVLEATSSSAAAINVSKVYIGPSTNLGTVAQAKSVVQLTWTGSLAVTHDADTDLNFSGGSLSESTTNFTRSGSVFTATVAGDYRIKCQARQTLVVDAATGRQRMVKIYKNSSTVPTLAEGSIDFGAGNNVNGGGEPGSSANALPPVGASATLNMAVGDTFRCKYYQANGTGLNRVVDSAWVFVEYFPTTSQQVLNANMDPTITEWTTYTTGCSGSWTGNVTYTCKHRRVGDSDEIQIKVLSTGSITPTNNNLSLNLPNGELIDTTKILNLSSGAQYFGLVNGYDGSTGLHGGYVAYNSSSSVSIQAVRTDATWDATATSYNSTGGTPSTFPAGAYVIAEFKVPIAGWSVAQVQMPIIVNSITSNNSGALRTEHAYILNSGSCAVSTQSSTWITSTTDPGVGQCGMVWASNTWSAAPWCVMTANANGAAWCAFLGIPTLTGVTSLCQGPAGGGTSQDSPFWISCTGPR